MNTEIIANVNLNVEEQKSRQLRSQFNFEVNLTTKIYTETFNKIA